MPILKKISSVDLKCKRGFITLSVEKNVIDIDVYSYETGEISSTENISKKEAVSFASKYGCNIENVKEAYDSLS